MRIYGYCSVYFTFVVVVSVSFVIVMASLSGLSHEERAARLQQRTREAETALKQLRICIEVIKQQSREQNIIIRIVWNNGVMITFLHVFVLHVLDEKREAEVNDLQALFIYIGYHCKAIVFQSSTGTCKGK